MGLLGLPLPIQNQGTQSGGASSPGASGAFNPDQAAKEAIAEARGQKQGGFNALQFAGNVIKAPLRALAAPFALVSEAGNDLAGTQQSSFGKALSNFAFSGTDKNSYARSGAALTDAVNIGAFALPGASATATFGQNLGLMSAEGATLGLASGVGSGLMRSQNKGGAVSALKNAMTDGLFGMTIGAVVAPATYAAAKGIGDLFNPPKSVQGSGNIQDVQNAKTESEIQQMNSFSENYKRLHNLQGNKNPVVKIGGLLADINNPETSAILTTDTPQNIAIREEAQKQLIDLESRYNLNGEGGLQATESARTDLVREMMDEFRKQDASVGQAYQAGAAQFSEQMDAPLYSLQNAGKEVNGIAVRDMTQADHYLSVLNRFDPEAKIVDGSIEFGAGSKLTNSDKSYLTKWLADNVSKRADTPSDFLGLAGAARSEIPKNNVASGNIQNFFKQLDGSARAVVRNAIDDPAWTELNDTYGAWQDYKTRMQPVFGIADKPATVKRIQGVINMLSSMTKGGKNVLEGEVKNFDQMTGNNFFNQLKANEVLEAFFKSKGSLGSPVNPIWTMLRVLNVTKTGAFDWLLTRGTTAGTDAAAPAAIQGIAGAAQGLENGIVGGLTKNAMQETSHAVASQVGQNAATNIPTAGVEHYLQLLAAKIGDPTISMGLKGILTLMAKELIFPTPEAEIYYKNSQPQPTAPRSAPPTTTPQNSTFSLAAQ